MTLMAGSPMMAMCLLLLAVRGSCMESLAPSCRGELSCSDFADEPEAVGVQALLQKQTALKSVNQALQLNQQEPEAKVATDATLDEAGYQSVYSLCCEYEMHVYIKRMITEALNLELCNDWALLGFVPLHTCAAESGLLQQSGRNFRKANSYQELVDALLAQAPPASCAWVAPTGTCPSMGPECHGEYKPESHRRRQCSQKVTTTAATTSTEDEGFGGEACNGLQGAH